jgi:tetratricopeptide (TPR) repeat protein
VMASQRALEALAYEDALRNFDAARTLLPESDRAAHARVLRHRALALRGMARTDQALAAFAEALTLAAAGPDRDAILYERARLQLDLFHGREALADLQVLLAHAHQSGDRPLELSMMLDLGRAHYILSLDDPSFVQPTRESYERTYALARELGDRSTMAKALALTTWLTDYIDGYREQAIKNVTEANALAERVGDEDLQIECSMARQRFLTPGQAAPEADRLRERLKARRDPIRLKEHSFLMMWHCWGRAEFERCVEVCDEGTALAAELGSEPVQYSTIKAFALMDLGRFDAAWDALQQEVADDRHPFGRAMRQLGVAVYVEHLSALDRAAKVGREVMEEAGRLSRRWMQQWMVDLLTTVSARLGDQELRTYIDTAGAANGFRPSGLAMAERCLSEGNPGEALELIRQFARGAEQNGVRRHHIVALEAELRALGELGHWAEMVQRADVALAEAAETGFKAMSWRIRGHRACARLEIGDQAGAERDTEAACQLLKALAATVPDPTLRASLEADPAAR